MTPQKDPPQTDPLPLSGITSPQDRMDTLDDAALNPPPALSADTDGSLDDQTDGDRQLTTDSDAIDSGLNDSDLGEAASGGMASRPPTGSDGPPTGSRD